MRILLVEDNFAAAESLMRALSLRGFAVVHAASVDEAVAAYEPDGFDVIVADYELPDGTGLDFLARIRGSDKAVTVMHSGLDRSREAAQAGMHIDHYVNKGDPVGLLDVIDAARV